MICGYCSETIEGTPDVCPACSETPLLDARYRLDTIVGRGAMGVTYRAERLSDGRIVAIKELPFRRIDAVKTKAMFAREARVLEQLDHPGIPAYLDDFLGGVGKNLSLYLVQTFVEGQTLKAEMTARRWREDEVLALIADVADILVYLHELSPPVIHRDIKPGNIMRRADDSLALIDFGAVRDALDDEHTGGSTVVGTYGFMAPEQFRGDASPASDLYALGATAVALLSRKTPDTMVDVAGHLDWTPHIDVHPHTQALLEGLLQIDPTRRSQKARTVAQHCRSAIAAIEAARTAQPVAPARNPAPKFAPAIADRAPAPQAIEFTDRGPPPKASPKTGLIAGVALFMIAVVVIIAAASTRPNHSAALVDPAKRCGEKPCPPVARGLKGLEFGMTHEEAVAALPALADVPFTHRYLPVGIMNLNRDAPQLLGKRAEISTTLGSLPATCELDFVDSGRLARMQCRLEPLRSEGSHIAAQDALVAALSERYGPPSNQWSGEPNQYMDKFQHDWKWEDKGATLHLSSWYSDTSKMMPSLQIKPDSKISLTNESPEYQRIVDAAEARVIDARRAHDAQEQRKADEATRKAREALSNGKLGDDL